MPVLLQFKHKLNQIASTISMAKEFRFDFVPSYEGKTNFNWLMYFFEK